MNLERDRAEKRFVLLAPSEERGDLSTLRARLGLTDPGLPLCFERLFRPQHLGPLARMLKTARSRVPCLPLRLDRFESYILIGCNGPEVETVRQKLLASGLPWYLEESSIPSGDCDLEPSRLRQRHLAEAPLGIDACSAWSQTGGKGSGIRLADVENGWDLKNNQLQDVKRKVWGYNSEDRDHQHHGTAVLGIIAAADDGEGSVGIATAVDEVGLVGVQEKSGSNVELASAILTAMDFTRVGDILLIEQESLSGARRARPVEVEPAVSDLLRLASALGIVVIEPAGNGWHDLSDRGILNPEKGSTKPLDPKLNGFQDSGAIMVGGLDPETLSAGRMNRHWSSNWGDRVDCCAWASSIETIGVWTMIRRNDRSWILRQMRRSGVVATLVGTYCMFKGTSGAAALVAGAALAIQGIAAAQGDLLDPLDLRDILRDPRNGTETIEGAGISQMPDLSKVTKAILGRTKAAQQEGG